MKSTLSFLKTLTLMLPFVFSALSAGTAAPAAHKKYLVYVGTYTEDGSESKGIYAYRFDSSTGAITSLELAARTINPSFLAVHPNHRFLYAVNEVQNYSGQKSGAVSAFAIERVTGKLRFLNQV